MLYNAPVLKCIRRCQEVEQGNNSRACATWQPFGMSGIGLVPPARTSRGFAEKFGCLGLLIPARRDGSTVVDGARGEATESGSPIVRCQTGRGLNKRRGDLEWLALPSSTSPSASAR